jgi:ribosomal protein S20
MKETFVEEMIKQGIIHKNKASEQLRQTIKNKEKELEHEAKKHLYPKIPYVDY